MSSYSVSSGLKSTLLPTTFLAINDSNNCHDFLIQFHSAKNLPKMDIIDHADPYFIAKIDDQLSFTSTIIPNTSAPQWKDEKWIVRNIPSDAKLTVKIYDKDVNKVDDYIGEFVVHDLLNYHSPSKGHKIIGSLNHHNGYFHLSIHLIESSEETKRLPRYTFDGPCRYNRRDSLTVGRLTMLNADCIYSTWNIDLRRISHFFKPHDRQYWNKAYRAAQAIFSDCSTSLISKTAIKLAHKVLYGRKLKNNENGRLTNVNDLWKSVFIDKVTKTIKPCVYTYVIDDNTWKFSETGVQFFADIASKHALLANGSEHVRYAGEFHPRPKYGWDRLNDEWELVFDNGSGTYAPSSDLLINLKQLLMFNFPGLNIVTYDYNDPQLKQSINELRHAAQKFNNLF